MSSQRLRWLYPAALGVVFLLVASRWIVGDQTLYLRDVLNSHFPLKWSLREALLHGYMPLVDPARASGGPLAGNLNALAFYPTTLLYLVAPPLWAHNAHFWLHWGLAIVAAFWMGRRFGLEWGAAWVVGAAYAFSGFFLSQMNLYNLVTSAALTPAFIAACVGAEPTESRSRRWEPLALGLLWALLLLAGEPFVALLALVAGGAARLIMRGPRSLGRWELWLAGVLGSLVALPQWVEFLRILPESYRGLQGFDDSIVLAEPWNPITALEWLVPLFFGRPELQMWGVFAYAGFMPLFLSAYPGLLCLVLVAASRPRERPAFWCWMMIGIGAFIALGPHNPLLVPLAQLPGAGMLRYIIKSWLLVALGASLLCGLGFRVLDRDVPGRLWWLLTGLATAYCAGLVLLRGWRPEVVEWMSSLAARYYRPAWLLVEAARIERLLRVGLASVLVLALILWWWRRGGDSAFRGPVLLLLHAASQVVLLGSLVASEDAEAYREPPPALRFVGVDEPLVQARSVRFESESPRVLYPEMPLFLYELSGCAEIGPPCGVRWDRRYTFNVSPERLDSFYVVAAEQALQILPDDAARIRLLRAEGSRALAVYRRLESSARGEAVLRASLPSLIAPFHVYGIDRPLGLYWLVSSAQVGRGGVEVLQRVVAPGFDPHREVILWEGEELSSETSGVARLLRHSEESWEFDVSGEVPQVLVVNRAYSSLYRASIDGEPAQPTIGNFSRLALRLPAGEHRARLWVDRSSLLWSSLVATAALLAMLALVAVAPWRRGASRDVPAATSDVASR